MDVSEILALVRRHDLDNTSSSPVLPGLSIYRRDAVSDIEGLIYEPVICLILQGSKVTSIGDQSVELRPGDALLVSHDLPVLSRITLASTEEPYIALILALDLKLVRGLYERVGDALSPPARARSLSAAPAETAWLEPLGRYIALAGNPVDARVLGPSVLGEIHYRLLMSPMGGMLRNLVSVGSHASRIARAIRLIRSEFRAALSVSKLAAAAGMSASSFHSHFRSVTGTTPLQYQKDLRLIEARSILAGGGSSVSSAAFAVGYESPTHFSRDYSKKFGSPPSRDTGPALRQTRPGPAMGAEGSGAPPPAHP